MANIQTMSSAPVDRERKLRRVSYALVHGNALSEPEVLIAEDGEGLNEVIALDLIASTEPNRLGHNLAEIRNALVEGRWAEALVAWMDATGRVVDVYPDEPIRAATHDDESIELELKLKPIFDDITG